jgi:hypothetical protein
MGYEDGMNHLSFVIYMTLTTRSFARTVSQKLKLRQKFHISIEKLFRLKNLDCEHFADFFSRPQLAYFCISY